MKWQRFMGWLLSSTSVAYVAWGFTAGDPKVSPVGPLIFAGVILAGGLSLIHGTRARKQVPRVSITEQIAFLVERLGGEATAAAIAADSTFSYEEVLAELERLAKTSECVKMEIGDGSAAVYRFPLISDEGGRKRTALWQKRKN